MSAKPLSYSCGGPGAHPRVGLRLPFKMKFKVDLVVKTFQKKKRKQEIK